MSKASQRTLGKADPPQSFTGLDTTTNSQKDTEPEKTLVNVSTAFNKLRPAPEEVVVHDSTTESRTDADTLKAPQRALYRADNPPQSSPALHTATNSQKDIEPEKTLVNVGTPSLGKITGSFKNQCTSGNIDVPAQDSRFTSEDVKDGTVFDHLPSHTAHSDHSNPEVMNQNEKSRNPGQRGAGVSTLSIKLQEETEVNQLPQKGELCSTEDAEASDPAQVKDGQATVPIMEEDTNQEMAKYEEVIQGLKAKILSMETFANQRAREQRETIERLETKISAVQVTTPCMEEDGNERKAKYEEVIRGLKTKPFGIGTVSYQEAREHEEKIKRLEAKISSIKTTLDQQKQEYKEEIEYFKARISTVEALLFFMEQEANTEHKREIERLKGKHEKEIQRWEEIVAEMDERALKLQKEIQRLQPKVSSEEDVKQPKARQARDPTKSPDEKPVDLSDPPQAQVTKPSSTDANQKIDGLGQGSGIKKEQNKSLPGTSEETNMSPPQTVVSKADSLFVTDVANLVKTLNAEIGQTVNLLAESLSDLEPLASDNGSEIAFDQLRNYIDPWLCDKLRENPEPDPLIIQLTLQTGLANACSSIVNDSPLWYNGSSFHRLYKRMAEKEGQAAADDWKAKASNYLDLPQGEDANKKYLTEVVLKLATAVVGGTLKGNETLLSQINQQVEVMARMATKLHKTITEDVTSSELITFTVSCDTEFDASQMEDSEGIRGSTPCGKVICTQDMGLLYKKRVGPEEPHGSLKDWDVIMKAIVVLAAMLEA